MLEPSKKDQNLVKQSRLDDLIALNILSYQTIRKVRRFTNNLVETIFKSNNPKRYYTQIELKLIKDYGKMFKEYKPVLVDILNTADLEEKYLVEQTLGGALDWKKIKPYKKLPETRPFAITNRILKQKSILKRNKKLANRVTKIIKQSVDKGRSIDLTTRLLDIEFGFRNRQGKTTKKALKAIKEGRLAHTNGHIYQTYRIARTESMRMVSIASNNIYDQVPDETKRLKMISQIDSRTRAQSIAMNNQISRKDGKFLYPDGNYYRHGEAPARYSINDRETTITVFLRDKKVDNIKYKNFKDYKRRRLDDLYI